MALAPAQPGTPVFTPAHAQAVAPMVWLVGAVVVQAGIRGSYYVCARWYRVCVAVPHAVNVYDAANKGWNIIRCRFLRQRC
jgi:hypothetical protein